jgi:CHAT domain-containing protein
VHGDGLFGPCQSAGEDLEPRTLWSVPDASAARFVTRLFTRLKAGAPPDQALMKTKREMARHPRFGDPVHWAGFVLYGAQGAATR